MHHTTPPPLDQCERTKQGPEMAATAHFGRNYPISSSVAPEFKFNVVPGDWGVYALSGLAAYSPFPVVASRPVTITATLSNIGSMAGKVGVIALWFRPDDGYGWDPYLHRPIGDISGAAATLDYTNRVLRPGQALKVGASPPRGGQGCVTRVPNRPCIKVRSPDSRHLGFQAHSDRTYCASQPTRRSPLQMSPRRDTTSRSSTVW